jgi:DNA helicase-2/ATP-dependent DNA helicase PcrA
MKPIVTCLAETSLTDLTLGQIQHLQKTGTSHIAIICKTAKESEQVYSELKSRLDLKLIKKETASYEPGVIVIPAYLANGIEFDAVILYDASVYSRESERKLFYTACTRAMHELYVNCSGDMNDFIKGVNVILYEKNQI